MTETIIKGLKNAFDTNVEFQGFDYADLKPEYLLKYQIASQIKSDFPDYKIRLENSTEEFKKLACDINDLLEYPNFYKKWQISRDGFIDIAVYNSDYKSIYPIEVKLVNPQKKRAIKDLVRLLEFINNENIESTIKCGYFVYVFKELIFDTLEQIPLDIGKAKLNAQKLIMKLTENVRNNLTFEYYGDSIGNFSNFDNAEQTDGLKPFDLGELIKENVHYVGIVIKIINNKNGIQHTI